MTAGSQVDGERVQADVNYVWNPPADGDEVLEFVTEHEERSTMRTLPGRPMRIRNARGIETDLEREGFVLVRHVSAVADFGAIEEDQTVDQQYIEEMTELLRQVTGASRAMMLGGGKKRYGETAADKLAPLTNAKPARYPHADNTDVSSVETIEMIASFVPELAPAHFRRWAMYNLWRCVTPPPQDIPLAVCDARTVAAARRGHRQGRHRDADDR